MTTLNPMHPLATSTVSSCALACVALGLCAMRASAAPAPAVDLGEQVRSANRVGFAVFPKSARQGHDLVCWTTTTESGGHFVAYDLTTREAIVHPLRSPDAWPKGRVMLASEKALVVADVGTDGAMQVLRTIASPLPVVRVMPRGGQVIVAGPAGFATVDPNTGAANHFCSTPFDSRWAIAVTANSVFFGKDAKLMMAPVPAAQGAGRQ